MSTPTQTLPEPPLRVLVADDHPVVRAGLVAMLEREPDMTVVCEASHGADAIASWRTHAPDVGLIDLSMPVLDGFGAVTEICRLARSARLVVMTTISGDEDVFRALQAGAWGYLRKDCGQRELVHCIRSVARGQRYLQACAAAQLAERVTSVDLTDREAEVLSWLAQGLSNKRIARHMDVAEGTVKTHVKNLLCKLDVSSRTHAVLVGLQRGLVHLASAPEARP